jgi:hypothetical protein
MDEEKELYGKAESEDMESIAAELVWLFAPNTGVCTNGLE